MSFTEYFVTSLKLSLMKYLIFTLFTLFSCSNENEVISDLNNQIQSSNKLIDSLQIELDNCKLNYKALDNATE